jgi:hypothetical protein
VGESDAKAVGHDLRQLVLAGPCPEDDRMISSYLQVTFVSAELIFMLSRSADILIAVKSQRQRTPEERGRIGRGLIRSIVVEALVFVPASATLLYLSAPLLAARLLETADSATRVATHTVMGVVSYGFPFVVLKRAVTRIALNTLREFAVVAVVAPDTSEAKTPDVPQGGG